MTAPVPHVYSQTATATYSVTVNPNATISLTSKQLEQIPNQMYNTKHYPATYTIGVNRSFYYRSATNGLTGIYNAGYLLWNAYSCRNFPHTVTTLGPCFNVALSGSIAVDPGNRRKFNWLCQWISLENPYNNPIVYSKNLIARLSTKWFVSFGNTGNII
jgi:hypothetical protein